MVSNTKQTHIRFINLVGADQFHADQLRHGGELVEKQVQTL